MGVRANEWNAVPRGRLGKAMAVLAAISPAMRSGSRTPMAVTIGPPQS